MMALSIFLSLYLRENKWFAFLTGISFAFFILLKSSNLILFIFILLSFLILELKTYGFKLKKLSFIFFILAGFALIYSPWLYRNYKVFNEFVIATGGGVTLYHPLVLPHKLAGTKAENEFYKNDPVFQEAGKMNELERDKFFYKKSLEIIRNKPIYFVKNLIFHFFKLWRLYPYTGKTYAHSDILLIAASLLSYGLLLPFAIYGAFLGLKELDKTFLLYLPIITYSLIHSIMWSQIRYRLPLEPFVIIFASNAFVFLLEKFNSTKLRMKVIKNKIYN